MKSKDVFWIAFTVLIAIAAYTVRCSGNILLRNEENDFDFEPDLDYEVGLHPYESPKNFLLSALPRSTRMRFSDEEMLGTTTECVTNTPSEETTQPEEEEMPPQTSTEQPTTPASPAQPPPLTFQPTQTTTESESESNTMSREDQEIKAKQLRNLVQHLYIAQARVQLEATEIKKAQAVANTAQQALEEAASHVRTITASLQSSQQEVASAAIRAQTAQLQLAAHDQLLFAARQDVDALSSQMVGLQAEEGISQPKITVDLSDLLEKLKRPLAESEIPTPVPPIIQLPSQSKSKHMSTERRYQQQHILPGFRDLYLE